MRAYLLDTVMNPPKSHKDGPHFLGGRRTS